MQSNKPPIVFTKPSEPCRNNLLDNVHDDLIVCEGDTFVSGLGVHYVVEDMLGNGTFGQVFKCSVAGTEEKVAVKVIKNQPAYFHQARVEIGILQFLNTRADPGDCFHIVRLKDFFIHCGHLCLVFELLGLNLYELVRHNKFKGLSLPLIRVFLTQILEALVVLHDATIIHCDLKPENILLYSPASGAVKVIDFGSACFSNRTVYSYVQSRFYRSPEVVLGHPYSTAVDMWSLGCVAAELFLGLPLFPAACEFDLLGRMIETIGQIPESVLRKGKYSGKYFCRRERDSGVEVQLRTKEEFEQETGVNALQGKQYFKHRALADIINAYPFKSSLSDSEYARERRFRESFTDFLLGLLELDPAVRWTPRQALRHPFITGEPFHGPFQPQPEHEIGQSMHVCTKSDFTAIPQQSCTRSGVEERSVDCSSLDVKQGDQDVSDDMSMPEKAAFEGLKVPNPIEGPMNSFAERLSTVTAVQEVCYSNVSKDTCLTASDGGIIDARASTRVHMTEAGGSKPIERNLSITGDEQSSSQAEWDPGWRYSHSYVCIDVSLFVFSVVTQLSSIIKTHLQFLNVSSCSDDVLDDDTARQQDLTTLTLKTSMLELSENGSAEDGGIKLAMQHLTQLQTLRKVFENS